MTRKLDRLSPSNSSGLPFIRLWQRNCEIAEANFDSLQQQVTDIATVLGIANTAQAAADAAQASADNALSTMAPLAPITITADYQGTVDPSAQLPMDIQAARLQDTTDVSASSAWSIGSATGAVTASIGSATGLITISGAVGSDVLTVTSVYNSVTRTALLVVTLSIAGTPSSGGGGSSSTDTTFASFNSTTHAAVSDELTAIVAASGNVTLSAPLTVSTAVAAPTGTFKVWAKWQWFDAGTSTWTDLAIEVASSPSCAMTAHGVTNGTLRVPDSKTGLTPGNSEKFRLMARNDSGTRTMYLTGTASAVSS